MNLVHQCWNIDPSIAFSRNVGGSLIELWESVVKLEESEQIYFRHKLIVPSRIL